jgi:hypothetical protein
LLCCARDAALRVNTLQHDEEIKVCPEDMHLSVSSRWGGPHVDSGQVKGPDDDMLANNWARETALTHSVRAHCASAHPHCPQGWRWLKSL